MLEKQTFSKQLMKPRWPARGIVQPCGSGYTIMILMDQLSGSQPKLPALLLTDKFEPQKR
jgi:hypothetical protein